ncbi:Phosphoribulokinase, chromosomal [Gammaproteobacteria bacterium]
MSIKHPIVAVTGSSGAGTTTVKRAFQDIFRREGLNAVYVDGNAFRRFDRLQMKQQSAAAIAMGRPISHFGPEANLFDRLEGLFQEYSRTGTGLIREYIENDEIAERLHYPPGTFTPWRDLPLESDLLFYEGLHGGCIEASWSRRSMGISHNPRIIRERMKLESQTDAGVDVARWVDLLIGVVPIINLEWIQKIHSDVTLKGASQEAVVATILQHMPDYLRYIIPQFSLTDINFQRIPIIDTSNPFVANEVPTADESFIVARFREPKGFDFPNLLTRIHDSFMSRPNTLVIPGGSLKQALEIICSSRIRELVERRRGT